MLYREYPPSPDLAPYVDCLWTACVPAAQTLPLAGGAHRHRVLPDNCVDILWYDDGRAPFAVGMMSTAFEVVSGAPVRTVAVRFKPGAAALFLGVPLHPLTDARAELDLLWGASASARLNDSLWQDALSARQQLGLIEQYLSAQLQMADRSTLAAPGARLVARALALLDGEGAHGGCSGSGGGSGSANAFRHANGGEPFRIDALAAALGVSRQHLAAQFRERVGLAPKLYARIARFRRAHAALQAASKAGGVADGAQLALACGYYDQSHLIHDFQDLAGRTPAQLLAP